MKLRTHESQLKAAGFEPGMASLVASAVLFFILCVKQFSRIAIRLLAAVSLLTAQISASYAKTGDPEEPAPSGTAKGLVARIPQMLPEYYELRGWSADGRPKDETLARLGLA